MWDSCCCSQNECGAYSSVLFKCNNVTGMMVGKDSRGGDCLLKFFGDIADHTCR